ncbi:MAG TPA: hypothetical protein DDZ80_00590 [Cyanobacteria bacterium UBA8803]|nr:hypothetical protein [Cyanobacteria bacterium UBA8803]
MAVNFFHWDCIAALDLPASYLMPLAFTPLAIDAATGTEFDKGNLFYTRKNHFRLKVIKFNNIFRIRLVPGLG